MGEVIRMQVNVVGVLSDADEINEILDVSEIFVIEKRMIELTYPLAFKNKALKSSVDSSKKSKIYQNQINGYLKSLTVRGLS
jgi:hypothetical protein